MAPKSDLNDKPRFMTQAEVARELGYRSSGSVRNLIDAGLLVGVKLNTAPNAAIRVTRASFESYCAQVEAEGAARFGQSA